MPNYWTSLEKLIPEPEYEIEGHFLVVDGKRHAIDNHHYKKVVHAGDVVSIDLGDGRKLKVPVVRHPTEKEFRLFDLFGLIPTHF